VTIEIIQGGMGAGVSDYRLARAVSSIDGCLGVVSGTALGTIMARRLQDGDPTGEIRSALWNFPDQRVSEKILKDYFVEGGKKEDYKLCPRPNFVKTSDNVLSLGNDDLEDLIIAANFVEVFLAKQGHDSPVGINFLHKIQWPTMSAIQGAMLADVDYIFMGAGLPKEIPDVIEGISNGENITSPINVENTKGYSLSFSPRFEYDFKKPLFVGIVANHLGAKALPNVDGFIIEESSAGGHNAPARSKQLKDNGEPSYGPKDETDFKLLNNVLKGRPYWLAGNYAGRLQEAQDYGAEGIQVGTLFEFSEESGLEKTLKQRVLRDIIEGGEVFTDPRISPSGYPFKIYQIDETIASKEIYEERERKCNLGYLVELYEKENGKIGTRCPAERVDSFIIKGGDENDAIGRGCLCNGLLANIGLGTFGEFPIVTAGSNLSSVRAIVKEKDIEEKGFVYTAEDAVNYLLN
jgi:nitronate monooxygenase